MRKEKTRTKKRIRIKDKAKALRIACSFILCVALLCALMELSRVPLSADKETQKTAYYGLAFLFIGLYEFASFLYQRKANPHKVDFVRLFYVAVCLTSMFCAFIVPDKSRLNILAPAIYLSIPIVKRFIIIFSKRKVYSRVYSILTLIFCILAELATFSIWAVSDSLGYDATPLISCFAMILTCLINICMMVFSQFNKEILLRIVRKTYAGEILLGMLLLIVSFSLVFMHNEENIHSFEDALWYCFAIVTTIGFGDFTAVTLVGRILTVILGIYGIVAVAILTSIIVNFYNEIKMIPTDDESDGSDPITPDTPIEDTILTETDSSEEIVPNEDTDEPVPDEQAPDEKTEKA